MSKRIFYGVLYSVFVIYFLYLNTVFAMTMFSAAITVLACSEILDVMGIKRFSKLSLTTYSYAILGVFSQCLMLKFPQKFDDLFEFLFFIYTLANFALMLTNKDLKFKVVAKIYSVTVFVVFSMGSLLKLQNYTNGRFDKNMGSFWVLIALLIAWCTDIGSYFCGTFFGRNRLCKAISPKKTVEGFFGGIIFCVISLTLIVFLAKKFVFLENISVDYPNFIMMTLLGSLISVFGDLCFSFIKRSCRVKDFGELIPGHGGILDRFDSVIFVAPYFYFALKFLKIFT